MRVYVNYCTIHVRSVHVRACAYSYVMVIAFRGLRPRVYTKKSAAAAAEPHVHLESRPQAGDQLVVCICMYDVIRSGYSVVVHVVLYTTLLYKR